MKKFLLLLCLVLVPIGVYIMAANDQGQVKITKNFKNTTVQDVFKYLEKTASIKIVYNPKQVNDTKQITRSFKEVSPLGIIRAVIGANFTMSRKGNVITIRPKEAASSSAGSTTATTKKPTPSAAKPTATSTKTSPSSATNKQTQASPKSTSTQPAAATKTDAKPATTTQSSQTAQDVTITKKFKKTPLLKIFNYIEKKSGYKVVYNPEQLNDQQLVTRSFTKETPVNVVRAVVGSDYALSKKAKVITIKLKKSAAARKQKEPKIDENGMVSDTVNDDPYGRKGHYVQTTLGLGYGSMFLGLRDNPQFGGSVGNTRGNFGANLQVAYAYYFHKYWGSIIGLSFSNYWSTSKLNTTKTWKTSDIDQREAYTHYAKTNNWKEKELLFMLEIPLGIQFQHPISRNGTSIYWDAGLKLGVPLKPKYSLQGGTVSHQVHLYASVDAMVEEVPSYIPNWEVVTEEVGKEYNKDKHGIDVKPLSIGVMADLGFMIPMSEQLDFMIGAYFQISCNNMKDDGTPIGWSRPDATSAFHRRAFMNQYSGIVASEYTKSVHPYQVGLKIGISWHHKAKTSEEPAQQIEQKSEEKPATKPVVAKPIKKETPSNALKAQTENVEKLTPEEERIRIKTIRVIKKLTATSVIWFDVGSSEPKLKPADIIQRIAAVLKQNPKQKIYINGHSSKDGDPVLNQKLSESRAQAVYDLFIKEGVDPFQMRAQGLGTEDEYSGKKDNQWEHDITLDRRVEIVPVQ